MAVQERRAAQPRSRNPPRRQQDAEGVGFEPTESLRPQRFSRRTPGLRGGARSCFCSAFRSLGGAEMRGPALPWGSDWGSEISGLVMREVLSEESRERVDLAAQPAQIEL